MSVILMRDKELMTISVHGSTETMHIGEWSKLIAKPTKPIVYDFSTHQQYIDLPSDSGPSNEPA